MSTVSSSLISVASCIADEWNVKHTAPGSRLRAQTRRRAANGAETVPEITSEILLQRRDLARARPRPVTEFLNSWTTSISREGSDAVTYLPRLYLAQEAAREENVAQEEGIISHLTEQGETLPPQRREWEGMDISVCSSSSTTTAASYPGSLSPFYFYYARLSRRNPRNIPPHRCTDLLLLVLFTPSRPTHVQHSALRKTK